MKSLAYAATALGLLAISFPSGAISEGIQRCQQADGTAIYTDKACGSLSAKPAPLSGELLTRIAMDRSLQVAMDDGAAQYRDASELLPVPAVGRRSLSGGCARTPRQLSADLMGAFALGDVNRIAESYYWTGMQHRQAMGVMQRLDQLADKPLAEARFLAAWVGSGDTAAHEIPADSGLMQLVFAGDGMHVVSAEVQRYSGCYFIRL
jgi:hypothetical protein